MLWHVVVASACESLNKDGRIEVVRFAKIVQGFAVIADHSVDHADQQVWIHCLITTQVHCLARLAVCVFMASATCYPNQWLRIHL